MLTKDWEASYWSFSEYVVPGSAKKVTEDQEHALYVVTLFKKILDEYRMKCRESK